VGEGGGRDGIISGEVEVFGWCWWVWGVGGCLGGGGWVCFWGV